MRLKHIFQPIEPSASTCLSSLAIVSTLATGGFPEWTILSSFWREVSMFRYRFWIHKKDKRGRPLDESIVKAAEEIAPTLARYRQREIRCESTTNSMIQSAVEIASKAKRARPLENPIAYLTFIYKRVVDRSLNRKRRLVPVSDDILEE